MDTTQISVLAKKYLEGTATADEQKVLHDWYDQVNGGDTEVVVSGRDSTLEGAKSRMLRQLQEEISRDKKAPLRALPGRRKWLSWAAAAVILAAVGTYLLRQPEKPGNTTVVSVPPAGNKATLTLGNGAVVDLSAGTDGAIAEQEGATVNKQQALLVYDAGNGDAGFVINKLTVPRGGKYRLILADGTKVWLNAASELQFPTAFPGTERVVELKGEGYFEVAQNAAKPFIVKTEDIRVEVLGTHFNVKAYADEPATNTALLEGSVRIVTAGGQSSLLKPGDLAKVTAGNHIDVARDPDPGQAVAWKDGLFAFRNTEMTVILREIGRWYDVDVSYEGPVTRRRFTGKVSRSYSLAETLSILEASDLHFRQEGKKIIVLP
ncbi:FecR family protein [Chitinophaga sp. GCM10012297]|uniref:FecR domain-containing protein n=1 Tax=Chitinophaga chungangae TaxID=2821488 RepID=A0ABS3Y9J7_9BACT|nr:FecR domain-containing protein [Chitinophaga chungangae]MBO9151353.1 FecR domain-containing protein [Chitinophaga chungangae]